MKIKQIEKVKEPIKSRFGIDLPTAILNDYLIQMVSQYERMPEAKSKGEGEYSKAKKTIFANILNIQHSINILNKHHF